MGSDLKGNLLKNVITRIDFNELYDIDEEKEVLKSVSKLCKKRGLKYETVRYLRAEEDFWLDDPVTLRDVPTEYIEKSYCHCYFDEEVSFVIEINNFFFRAIQTVNRDSYDNYLNSHLYLVIEVFELLNLETTDILRFSVKKVDETFFSTLDKMTEIIKPDLIQNNIFGKGQSWNTPNAGSMVVQNFLYDGEKINFRRKIDRVQLRKIVNNGLENVLAYRLYLEYEVYSRTYNTDISVKDNLMQIDRITKELFLETFTNDGRELITKGGVIGDVKYTEGL